MGLGSSPFARHYLGNHSYFLFLPVLRCFSSRRSPPSFNGYRAFNSVGFPIRTFMGHRSFAPHHDFSQLITSFIACKSLGIHHTPFLTSFATSKMSPILRQPLKEIYTFSCILISTRIRFLYVCRNMSKIAGLYFKASWRITDSNR